MSAVRPHPRGVTLAVKAKPNAKRNRIGKVENDQLRIEVTAAPEDGKANDAIVELLKDWLAVRRSEIEILTGMTSKSKVFLIAGRTVEELTARLHS